ncbi:MAG: hypothetical protein ACYC0F_09635 [Rhodanobacter sp.]
MGWNTLYFGVEAPSRGRRIAIHVLLLVLALAFYGFWVDFMPEPWVEQSCFYVSLVLGVAVAAWLAWVNLTGRNEAYRGGTAQMLLLAPFCALLAAFFIWCALARGVAGGITRIFGEAELLPPALMRTEHSRRSDECDYRLVGGPIDGILFDHLCTSAAYYEAHPHHRVEVVLKGLRGRLGFYVTGFGHRRDLGAYRP